MSCIGGRIIGGIERGASFPRSTMVGERGKNELHSHGEEGGYL